jgi:dienelactone hydrolase
MIALTRAPSRSQRSRIRSEVGAALELYEDSGWLARPERFHRAPPPLRRPRLTARRAAGIAFEHLEFRSGYRPRDGEPGRDRWLALRDNRTAHAWVLRHRDGPRPWLISIPGYRMGHPAIDLAGLRAWHHHFDLGFNVLIPVLPLHGVRAAGRRSGDGFISTDALSTIHAEAQAMWDVRRMLTWIRAEGAAGIGVFGVSLGGYNTALLASLERGLSCAVAGIPASCFPSLLEIHTPRLLLRLGEKLGLPWDDMRRIMRVISPLAMRAKVAVDRRFLFAGLADRLVPPEHVRRLWEHWERPRIAWYHGSHLSFHWEPEVRMLMLDAFTQTGLLPAAHPMRTRHVA